MTDSLSGLFTVLASPLAQGVLVAALGMLISLVVARSVQRRLLARGLPHRASLAWKTIAYVGTLVALLVGAEEAGFPLNTLLATAGIATVAIGFAAQTSLSNIIAGLFLFLDRPFQIGDWIELEGRSGTVERITLMSTYLRTFDNLLVRWPNEVVLKATVVNLASYPARRLQVPVGVAYGTDVARARAVLLAAVRDLDLVLLEPEPEILVVALGDSSVDLDVRIWVARVSYVKARSQVIEAVHAALGTAGIEIPFPQRSVWMRTTDEAGSDSPAEDVEAFAPTTFDGGDGE